MLDGTRDDAGREAVMRRSGHVNPRRQVPPWSGG